MLELLKPFWLIIAKWGVIIGGILLVLFKVRQSGKEAVENQNVKESLEGVKARDKIEDNVNGASDAEHERLRKKWER